MVLGVLAAVGVSRVLASVLVNTTATDPTTFVSICLLLGAVTLLACFVPARRATRLDQNRVAACSNCSKSALARTSCLGRSRKKRLAGAIPSRAWSN
jgi:hypothetical protein